VCFLSFKNNFVYFFFFSMMARVLKICSKMQKK
jgi:hypothetical protein